MPNDSTDYSGTEEESSSDGSSVVGGQFDGDLNDEQLNRKFLDLIEACDVDGVTDLLDRSVDIDVNHKNYKGMTGLHVAIETGCDRIVDLLLSRPEVEIGDALMYAIRDNRYGTFVKILDILQAREPPERVRTGYKGSAEFPQHVTPLMLAAQCGHYKIIKLLLERDHTIEIPHKPTCSCKEVCKTYRRMNDGLGSADLKYATFRALTNPVYILLTSRDPVLTVFELSRDLREHGRMDLIFKAEYETMDLSTRVFAVQLMNLCRDTSEVETLLTRRAGCTFFGQFPYYRLLLAVDLKQKEFVAHAYVQQTLEAEWTGDWYQWRRGGVAYKTATIFLRIPLLVYIAVLHLLMPYLKSARHYALPVNRMLNYLASYVVFLAMLTYVNNMDKTDGGGPNFDDVADYLPKLFVALYVVSFALRAINQMTMLGLWRYFSALWNLYDCVKLAVFVAVFVCWWLSYVQRKWSMADGDGSVAPPPPPIERKYWSSMDPTLVGEGLLAVATVMSYLRLLFLCQLSYALGPMQVSLGKMTTDFARFAALFGVVVVAFTAGLCRYYQIYEGLSVTDPITGNVVTQDESFVNVYATLKTLFWGIFCMSSPTAGSVVIDTVVSKQPSADDEGGGGGGGGGEVEDTVTADHVFTNHYFTQAVGTLLYAMFETLAVVVMLNMLVATMANTFQRVTGNSYVEWVFGRTRVFLSFFAHNELPPPLNVFPSPHYLRDMYNNLRNIFHAGYVEINNKLASSKLHHDEPRTEEEFDELTTKLCRRYFTSRFLDRGLSPGGCGFSCGR